MSEEEEKKAMENDILFQIDMELYNKFNDDFCKMNEYLGEIYSYADLRDLEDLRNATEIKLLRQAIKKQQKELEMYKNTGKIVRDKMDGTVGVVLKEWEIGLVQVLEKIQPKVTNTYDSWQALELLEERKKTNVKT